MFQSNILINVNVSVRNLTLTHFFWLRKPVKFAGCIKSLVPLLWKYLHFQDVGHSYQPFIGIPKNRWKFLISHVLLML